MPDQAPEIDRPPSEYFRGRCFLTTEPDEKMVPYVFETMGDDIVCYSSDYCHFDCAFPESVNILDKRSDLSDSLKQRLFAANAAKLYGFEVPA